MDDDEIRQNRALAGVIRAATLRTLAVVLVLLLTFEVLQLRNGGWAGAATLSLALLIGGYLVGLLFAVPKTPGAEGLTTAHADASVAAVSSDGTTVQGQRTVALQRRILLVNTSFEQISDWLTKIIVGVGLVQFQPILMFVEAKTTALANDLAGGTFTPAEAQPVAAAILIAFPALGVLLGFFSVRLYIAWAIYVADADATRPLDEAFTPKQQQLAAAAAAPGTSSVIQRGSDTPPPGPGGPAAVAVTLPPAAEKAVSQILEIPLSKLTSANDIVAWGRACFSRGRYADARDAFAQAIAMTNNEPEVVLDYAQTLWHLPPVQYDAMIAALERALPNLNAKTELSLRQRVTENLINAYLYTPPPKGFANAIRLGDAYAGGDGSRRYAAYVYLAAAHGQRYAYYKKQGDAQVAGELAMIEEFVRKAIEIGGNPARNWLARLTTPGGDDDLVEAVADSPKLKKQLDPAAP